MDAVTRRLADRVRDRLVAIHGPGRGSTLHRVEAFEGSEYGAPLDEGAIRRLFPFPSDAGG
jgi:hypothetical protein